MFFEYLWARIVCLFSGPVQLIQDVGQQLGRGGFYGRDHTSWDTVNVVDSTAPFSSLLLWETIFVFIVFFCVLIWCLLRQKKKPFFKYVSITLGRVMLCLGLLGLVSRVFWAIDFCSFEEWYGRAYSTEKGIFVGGTLDLVWIIAGALLLSLNKKAHQKLNDDSASGEKDFLLDNAGLAPSIQELPQTVPSDSDSIPRFCRQCGTKLKDGASFCPECGTAISISAETTPDPDPHETETTVVTEGEEKAAPLLIDLQSKDLSPLLRRAFILAEDGEWEKSDSYLEKVLDSEPENAYAYLGKLLVELKLNSIDQLCENGRAVSENKYFKRALRYADTGLKSALEALQR